MHHLGVPTTRALSLIMSTSDKVARGWYKPGSCSRNMDIVTLENTAITCRVSPSFIRVGHLQLFERKFKKCKDKKLAFERLKELLLMVEHSLFREYPEILERENVTISRLMKEINQKSFHFGNVDANSL